MVELHSEELGWGGEGGQGEAMNTMGLLKSHQPPLDQDQSGSNHQNVVYILVNTRTQLVHGPNKVQKFGMW